MDKLTKNLVLVLLTTAAVGLSACSSKPSPWSQRSSSPWAKEDVQEPAEQEQSPFVDQAAVDESMAVEPLDAGGEAMPYEEPAEPLPMQPGAMTEQEPMMAGPVGDIAAQPPGYYAVQLVASSSMKNLMAFTKRHNLSDQWIAETRVNGKTWFVLLSGVYATREEANAALEDARVKLDTRPWVRTIGSLQAVMVP